MIHYFIEAQNTLYFAVVMRGCDFRVFVPVGRSGENDSPMIFYSKAPAAVTSCQSSCRSAVCISCSKLAVTYKEGNRVS